MEAHYPCLDLGSASDMREDHLQNNQQRGSADSKILAYDKSLTTE
jgi:hypothetical protein